MKINYLFIILFFAFNAFASDSKDEEEVGDAARSSPSHILGGDRDDLAINYERTLQPYRDFEAADAAGDAAAEAYRAEHEPDVEVTFIDDDLFSTADSAAAPPALSHEELAAQALRREAEHQALIAHLRECVGNERKVLRLFRTEMQAMGERGETRLVNWRAYRRSRRATEAEGDIYHRWPLRFFTDFLIRQRDSRTGKLPEWTLPFLRRVAFLGTSDDPEGYHQASHIDRALRILKKSLEAAYQKRITDRRQIVDFVRSGDALTLLQKIRHLHLRESEADFSDAHEPHALLSTHYKTLLRNIRIYLIENPSTARGLKIPLFFHERNIHLFDEYVRRGISFAKCAIYDDATNPHSLVQRLLRYGFQRAIEERDGRRMDIWAHPKSHLLVRAKHINTDHEITVSLLSEIPFNEDGEFALEKTSHDCEYYKICKVKDGYMVVPGFCNRHFLAAAFWRQVGRAGQKRILKGAHFPMA